jgi:hypothetical protein
MVVNCCKNKNKGTKNWISQIWFISLQHERNLFRMGTPVDPASKAIKAEFPFEYTAKPTLLCTRQLAVLRARLAYLVTILAYPMTVSAII